jgi:hypothetical protein
VVRRYHIVPQAEEGYDYSTVGSGVVGRFKAISPAGTLLAKHESVAPSDTIDKHLIIPELKTLLPDEAAGSRARWPQSVPEANKICEVEASRAGGDVKLSVAVIQTAAMRDAVI